ncbi:bifunctional (p)ppGpp synthetase/guanosine-3',5'-bis(diphosphate) 3'-pyrophosphohydrolase [Roseomonas sp. NAR14]|uniref:GTP pyrophosphokinase rsh n=1 Tax=Roseomonas acroporae TaxID=2937791 RepID=A0A9X2BV21_9PROT|nr:bifunctional (p)ppGpp synthetase/guanosine-3',5'-bis(diphosphate) 3'-pyrophosphohydrolase [Roseomonas acroporae]MCK8783569.1 bifunctional (p)ppGpp synthetase/guanosine-3',5'-bis(diphosphate) 3'-pyrophosphohydrolase [Roseomonas acroporae]
MSARAAGAEDAPSPRAPEGVAAADRKGTAGRSVGRGMPAQDMPARDMADPALSRRAGDAAAAGGQPAAGAAPVPRRVPVAELARALAAKVATYDPKADTEAIERAAALADEAHGAQSRDNGDPYITHPLAVAELLAGYRLDAGTIVTALLHDTVEDTGLRLADIEKGFGREVARLVDGVTKLTRLEVQSERTKQAENFRKLVLAMSEDIRVLLVKLADRLHNMRTLHYIGKPERRQRIARETMDIYAPLAERIGMDAVKTELETLAFRELQPEAWQTISARLGYLRGQGADLIDEIGADIQRVLAEQGVPVIEVSGREKSPYSIWLKMHQKNVAFEQLSDIMAFRVLVPDKGDCYAALGAIHSAYRVVPGRFKDYISTPKTNGYQSLHTGVTVPARRHAKIEVQIRTVEMHEVAEFGVAAHWIYKQGPEGVVSSRRDRRRYPWVRDLLEILDSAAEPQEFLEHTKLELHRDQVFCFTPKGDLIALPRGATPVDFAYQVHSQVGDTCVGAKINGRIMPLRHALENGDQVEIITARGGTPNPQWERFVVTGKARARIRRFVHARLRQEQQESGRAALAKAFRQEGLDFSEKLVEPALKALKQPDFETLCVAVGAGTIAGKDVVHAVYPELRTPPRSIDTLPMARSRGRVASGLAGGRFETERVEPAQRSAGKARGAPITGVVAGMPVHYAGCCHPLPGERIVGIVSTGKGVVVHAADCRTLASFAATPERFLDVDWEEEAGARPSAALGTGHVGRISVVAANDPNVLATLANAVSKQDGTISNIRILHRATDYCEVQVDVEVTDVRHLSNIIAGLRACQGVTQVERAHG